VRKVIASAAIDYRDHVSKLATTKSAEAYVNYVKMGGAIHTLSQTDRVTWAKTMPNVAADWASGLEKKGFPGLKILKTYMDAMRAAGQPIVREWDKE